MATIIKDEGNDLYTLTDKVKSVWVSSDVLMQHLIDYPWYTQIVDGKTVYIFNKEG